MDKWNGKLPEYGVLPSKMWERDTVETQNGEYSKLCNGRDASMGRSEVLHFDNDIEAALFGIDLFREKAEEASCSVWLQIGHRTTSFAREEG
jgi:hypothetical protein